MEENSPVFGGICGPLSLQEVQKSIQFNHQLAPAPTHQRLLLNHDQVIDSFSFGLGNKNESLNYFAGYSQECSNAIDTTKPIWKHRLRWTDEMVKVLITAVSYVNEDALSNDPKGETSQFSAPLIKGKWRAISAAMVERGYYVSPQQCEDKFNYLNTRYKRLNEILGKGTSCEVFANRALLELINIADEDKEEVRKILTCKQLFYQEMCSYHNKNWKYLPHDDILRQSVRLALKGKVKYRSQNLILGVLEKRRKVQGEDSKFYSQADIQSPTNELEKWLKSRSLELEDKKLQIENEMFKLEKKKFEWIKLCWKEDKELHKMKLENELMKLENERLAYELKCLERSDDWE